MESEIPYLECDARLNAIGDVIDLIGTCTYERRAGLLIEEDCLPPAFFDLRSGFAGEMLQKLQNYSVRAAIVVADPASHGERFAELASESRRNPLLRFWTERAAAERWLSGS